MIYIIAAIVVAYILGSIPTAYIFGKILKGIDIRKQGSGNVGATNVFRVIGKGPAIVVFIIDVLKGFIAVTVIPYYLQSLVPEIPYIVYLILGAAAIAGHIWTCFLRFKGGKGVSTTAGVMAGLSPWVMVGGLVVWIIVFSLWKYVSLASISAAVSIPIIAVATGQTIEFVIFSACLCMVGVFSHKANIQRLIQGTEKKMVKAEKS